jgi:hypothetical protein
MPLAPLAAIALCGCPSRGQFMDRFGGHLGALVPVEAGDESFKDAVAFGAYYDFHHLRKPSFIFEGSVHYAKPVSSAGTVDSNLWACGINCLWAPKSLWAAQGWRPSFYVLGGVGLLLEDSTTGAAWGEVERGGAASTLSLGIGLSSPEKGWDVRLIYSSLPGAENVDGIVYVLGGWASSF